MTIQLENQVLKILISDQGAELSGIQDQNTNIEYLWQGDSKYWGRKSPILFPFVGRSIDDRYRVNGQSYAMGQHGFARDCSFEVISKTPHEAVFRLVSDASTKRIYPYDFKLDITYVLDKNTLQVHYLVENPSMTETLYFSIGAHPGFNVPLVEGTAFEDYFITFEPQQPRAMIPLKGPYLDLSKKSTPVVQEALLLKRSLFDQDALIYETSGKNTISIRSIKTEHSIHLEFEDFPFVGIWSPPGKNAPFVCIEPWFGIADTVQASGVLSEKFGVQTLAPKGIFKAVYSITVE